MRIALAVVVLTVSLTTARADDCFETAKLYGSIMRASLLCNFPETRGTARSIAVMQQSCPSPDAAKPGIEAGFQNFEAERTKVGERRACANWREFIRTLSQSNGR